ATPTSTGTCPLTQGYWKNHPNAWPVNTLILGNQNYSERELLSILATPSTQDASIILAKQLIAAKLNVASGASTSVASAISQADGLLAQFSGKLPYSVAPSSAIGQSMVTLGIILDTYNNSCESTAKIDSDADGYNDALEIDLGKDPAT